MVVGVEKNAGAGLMARAALAVVVLLGLTMVNPALAGTINPLDKEALPIPGGQGMEYFYEEWMPWGDASALIFKSMTFNRGGYITRDWWHSEDHTDDPPELFKVVAEDEKTMLFAVRSWSPYDKLYHYDFWSLTLRNPENTKTPALLRGSCWNRKFGEAEWQKPPEEILAYFKKSRKCNPLLSEASEEYPWERWSREYFSFVSR